MAAYLTPKFGYDKISELVKKSLGENKPFKQVMEESGLMGRKGAAKHNRKIKPDR